MKRGWWLPVLLVACNDATNVPGELVPDAAGPAIDMNVPAPDAGPMDASQPGSGFGEPCSSASDCESGMCVPGPANGGLCTVPCTDGEPNACRDGWSCENSVEYGGFVCRPPQRLALCEPCTDDWQCGAQNDLCLILLNGSGAKVCGRDCSSRACPAGFSCQMLGNARQCYPDGDLCPDGPIDDDGDGVADGDDNCVAAANPDQADSDGDGFGDVCDPCPDEAGLDGQPCPGLPPDRDGDGVPDALDNCPDQAGNGPDGCPGPPLDSDGDGVPDDRDLCPMEAGNGPEGCPPGVDSDGDGIPDEFDPCPDEPGPRGCPEVGPPQLVPGQFTAGRHNSQTFGRSVTGVLGSSEPHQTMRSARYRIAPISFGVTP